MPGSAALRALFDVSVFGFARDHFARHQNVRSGIFRVVEQAAVALSARPDVDLWLCAAERTESTRVEVDGHAGLRDRRFANDEPSWTSDALRRGVAAMSRWGAGPRVTLPLRAARRAVRELHRMRRPDDVDPETRLSRTTLARADVYHSTVYAIPDVVRATPGLRRFLTVYDVIPILLPELTFEGGTEWSRRVVGSVGPEDSVLAISQCTKDDLLGVRPGLDPARVTVTHLAADPALFYPERDAARVADARRRYGIPDGPYALSVCTLEPRKNLAHLLRTFADLVRAERLDDLRLVLTGAAGWQYERFAHELDRLGALRDRVVLTGYVDDADLAALYTGAEMFVYPSLYEGFGLPPLEAMQCGTPVVTSNTSSLPEVVGGAGLMVDPRDGDALAQAMLDVHRDGGLRARLARQALDRAAQFTWERHAQATAAAYRAAR